MSAIQNLKRVINDPALKNICFTLDCVRIVGSEYTKLLAQISNHTLQVGIDPTISTPANYDSARNVIRLKSAAVGNDVGSAAAIAHECTHAYLANQSISRARNEAAGYLVEVIYGLHKNENLTRTSIGINPTGIVPQHGANAIGQQALVLIDKKQLDRTSNAHVSADDLLPLEDAILSVPAYQVH